MNLLKVVIDAVLKCLSYKLSFGEFSFSLLSVFITFIIIGIVFHFIGKIFS